MTQSPLHVLLFVELQEDIPLGFLDFGHLEGIVCFYQIVELQLCFLGPVVDVAKQICKLQ